ncbi:uncharacterized protein E0L32_004442 [Thyridium curvatum]|uniref:Xylanolytic transcriptional activator regulatory domain-containing protein n=1 Tax=Thyridium curvatum TaxID=1093900 RepID=A0A507AZP3_9PEZI|nr:uncharacterized protein E0L32_004442 [Thyridium curvatum]TPX15462.1 hypothetical protein E0L32_004442 [Thyridium curvatum]
MVNRPDRPTPPTSQQDESISAMMGIIAQPDEGTSHVVSPAIADDDRVFQEYLSNTSTAQKRRMVKFHLNLGQPTRHARQILFNIVPKRGERETESRSIAASSFEVIEKLIDPYQDDLITLFFEKINICFPIFDEGLFRRVFAAQKEKISPGLLAFLYGNTLIYWDTSPLLSTVRCPDHRTIWTLAEDALVEELHSTPTISTIITIILNVGGRPSTHPLWNGGLLGLAVALANSFGLNRDPSDWNLSPSEKKFRMRIWWLLIIYDRWCSMAYGSPTLIQDSQHDVPILTIDNISNPGMPRDQIFAASCFIALITLTEVLGRCLEHVYDVGKASSKPAMTPIALENMLAGWEDSLDDTLRRLVIRGTQIVGAGAANLRLSYLSVKLLIRRIQLDWDKMSFQIEDTDSEHYIQARRICEEIVDFVRELNETHCRDFWIPQLAYTLTSATTFLMRCALNSRVALNNAPLKLARLMVDALQFHRRSYEWDIADNCLSNCCDLVEKIEAGFNEASPSNTLDLGDLLPVDMDMDIAALNGLFPEFATNF